jgi:hypothetical protein
MFDQELSFAEEMLLEGDRITNLILHSDVEWIDVEIRISEMRERCRELAPLKVELFEYVYASRFRRLWDQWRLLGDTSWTWRESGFERGTLDFQ